MLINACKRSLVWNKRNCLIVFNDVSIQLQQARLAVLVNLDTVNYPQKTGFHCNKSLHCAYIIYRVTTWFLKKDMLTPEN